MTIELIAHPFSSYCQKVLVALYENATPFSYRQLGPDDPQAAAELAGRTVVEASIIIEHLGLHHPGPVRLIPQDASAALGVRMLDRFFDNYVMTPMQKIVADSMRATGDRDPVGVNEARALLDTAYRWLDGALVGQEWAASTFSLADCAAAPALFYADWAHPIDPAFTNVHAYRRRLLARPSFARAVDEARPYRPLFPLGAPDRD
jgi:glutathione S-transferase